MLPLVLLSLQIPIVLCADFWTPSQSLSWDYHLKTVPKTFTDTVEVYDIDLFEAHRDVVDLLHDDGKKVICYFSAGSYEDWREDADKFNKTDLGKSLDGWKGERWLDLKSNNVRQIMTSRIKMAKSKNCDAVDPDNIDGYDNDTGFNLTEADSVEFVKFLATEGHKLGLAVGLKNGGAIVSDVVDDVEFSVQEQCVEYDECDLYEDFHDSGKPIFHIEYPKGDKSNSNDVSGLTISKYCDFMDNTGFSTILKNMNLDEWLVQCSLNYTTSSATSDMSSTSHDPETSVSENPANKRSLEPVHMLQYFLLLAHII